MSKPKIIAVISLKGGVAKTTSAVNIAACLAESGKKTLLIDMDPQTGASLHLGYDLEDLELTIADVLLYKDVLLDDVTIKTDKDNLFLVPSNENLSNIENELEVEIGRENILLEKFDGQIDTYDFIIIDSPPVKSFLLFSILKASDFAIVPFRTNRMSVVAAFQLVELMDKAKKRINQDIKILGYFGTMFDQRTKESQKSLDEMREKFKEEVFKTVIPTTTVLAQAAREGTTAFDHARGSKGSISYKELVDEILIRIDGVLK